MSAGLITLIDYEAGNLEWKGYNGSVIPMGDRFVWFYWQGGNPAIPADEPAVRYYLMGDVKDPQAPGNTWP